MQQMVRHSLGPQLLETVDVLLHQYSSTQPQETNEKGNSHQIALNFVKYITKILSLDPSLSEEVSGLRRTLLTQVSLPLPSPVCEHDSVSLAAEHERVQLSDRVRGPFAVLSSP
jgi:hypothetical protein